MSTYDTRQTPDYSPLLAHFTKDRAIVRSDLIDDAHPLYAFKDSGALDRLVGILRSKTLHASPMPYLPNSPSAACFTECVWKALVRHADSYSAYGVVFSKRLVHEQGGGPALYLRGDILQELGSAIPASIEPFVAPFDPDGILEHGTSIEFLHEREWRLPKSLTFDYSDVEYIIVESLDDAQKVINKVGTFNVPEHKFIPMQVYRTIGEAWKGE